MVLQSEKNNRLLVYFFYDKAGIVDDYIMYMLEKLKPHVKNIIFVSNGDMTPQSVKKVKRIADHVIERENKGMDVMAYKAAIDFMGYEKLKEYDELIMMNFTIMGPVTPLSDMFHNMDAKDIDFWGLTLFHGCDGDPFGAECEYGFLPMHIQSHFIAVRNSMLSSDDFKDYWESRPEIKYYSDAIGKHEAVFTRHFEELGYKWEVYSDTRDCMDYTDLPIISMPVKLIRDKKCPVFKRRNFFQEYFDIMNKSTGEVEAELYNYLKNNTDYDVNYIWDNMLRVQNISDIKKAVQLNYVLSTRAPEYTKAPDKKVLFVVFVSDIRHMYSNYKRLENLPDSCDMLLAAQSEEALDVFCRIFNCRHIVKTVVSEKINSAIGRLGIVRDEVKRYELVCFLNDFRENKLEFDSVNESFLFRCYSSLAYNTVYINNIINLFDNNERMGLLLAPPPNHADYYPTLGCFDWGDNFDTTEELAEFMGLNVNIDITKEPLPAYGDMFFARTRALSAVFDTDFEVFKETDNIDLIFERIYAYAAQAKGYYTAGVTSDEFAAIETTNLQYMTAEINRQAFALFGVDTHFNLVNKMRSFHGMYGECDPSSIEVRILRIVRKLIPRKLLSRIFRGIAGLIRRK